MSGAEWPPSDVARPSTCCVTASHLATMREATRLRRRCATARSASRGERIAWIGAGARPAARRRAPPLRTSCDGALGTPGLVDCHTHLVYAGNRADEFERRLDGATYADIARGGRRHPRHGARHARGERGRARRAEAAPRLAALAAEGVTTVEIKSGYGLDTANEAEAAARRRGALGAERRRRRAHDAARRARAAARVRRARRRLRRLRLSRDDSRGARGGLADAVDAFCETIGFTPAQTRRVFDAARAHGLPVKLHADQLSDLGGARSPPSSARCRPITSNTRATPASRRWRAPGTVAVLLPGAFYALRETRLPPVAALRAHGVPMAIATDCNPGTSPVDVAAADAQHGVHAVPA